LDHCRCAGTFWTSLFVLAVCESLTGLSGLVPLTRPQGNLSEPD
jgi:hypothetical protein